MSALQLSRDDLLRMYRTMRMIRRFEERVMGEMATGDIPGNTHLQLPGGKPLNLADLYNSRREQFAPGLVLS